MFQIFHKQQYSSHTLFLILTILLSLSQLSQQLYCQPDNCYQLLELPTSATQQQIKKSYRTLAKRYHPDRNRQQDTTQLFQKINIAYEILDNQNTRAAYDLFIVDPSGSRAYHTYQYYKASYSPQTNPFAVIIVFIGLMSWLQWVMRKQMYESAFNNIIESENFRIRVNQQCALAGKKGNRQYKEQISEKLQKEISIQGGYSQPKILDILCFKILFLPYRLVMYIYEWIRWIVKYYIKRQEYTQSDQQMLVEKALKISKAKWESIPEEQKKQLCQRKLWIKSNMKKYGEQMQAKQLQQIKQSNPAKYRKIMAYLKKNS